MALFSAASPAERLRSAGSLAKSKIKVVFDKFCYCYGTLFAQENYRTLFSDDLAFGRCLNCSVNLKLLEVKFLEVVDNLLKELVPTPVEA